MNEDEEAGLNYKMLESVLKKMFDKLKFHLCLKYSNGDYTVALVDGLRSDAVILNGDIVTIKIKTKLFGDLFVLEGSKLNAAQIEFKQLVEHCLRQVPRMQITLTHTPPADVLMFDEELRKFRKVTKKEYDKLHPRHEYEKEIHYTTDVRTTAIHWKSGTIVREFGATNETSKNNARRKIISVLSDPEVYARDGDNFVVVESHDDLIYDYVLQCRVFNKNEIAYIIAQLTKEYLS